jgi:hypothetical protein
MMTLGESISQTYMRTGNPFVLVCLIMTKEVQKLKTTIVNKKNNY